MTAINICLKHLNGSHKPLAGEWISSAGVGSVRFSWLLKLFDLEAPTKKADIASFEFAVKDIFVETHGFFSKQFNLTHETPVTPSAPPAEIPWVLDKDGGAGSDASSTASSEPTAGAGSEADHQAAVAARKTAEATESSAPPESEMPVDNSANQQPEPEAVDPRDARIAALEAQVAQLTAELAKAQAKQQRQKTRRQSALAAFKADMRDSSDSESDDAPLKTP